MGMPLPSTLARAGRLLSVNRMSFIFGPCVESGTIRERVHAPTAVVTHAHVCVCACICGYALMRMCARVCLRLCDRAGKCVHV